MKEILKANYGAPDKPLIIGEFEIPCYVLENEQRVITQGGLLKALGMSTGGAKKAGTRKIDEFLTSSQLKPFISKELSARANDAITFKTTTGTKAIGYEATILVDICDAVLEANKKGSLLLNQKHIAEQAEMLIRSLAKVGIIALIDEATGFQEVRNKMDLRKFLSQFLEDQAGKWVKTYSDDFFETIFKMKGWTWNIANGGKKPQVMGHYINNFVYSRLAPNVLKELRKLNPINEKGYREHKHTQYINPGFGHPLLKEHLSAVIALGKAAGYNWRNFQRLLNRALPRFGAPELPFDDTDIIE